MHRTLRTLLILATTPLACGDDGAAPIDDSTSDASTTSMPPTTTSTATSADATSSTESSEGSSSESTSEPGFDPPAPECGNGYVEVGEDCDDANAEDLDACPNDCIFPCSVEWDLLRSGPTLESDIYGVSIDSDAAGNVYAIAYQREIDVDPKGVQTIGEVSTLVLALDTTGAERWSTVLAVSELAVRPGAIAVDEAGVYVATTREDPLGGTNVQVVRLAPEDGEAVWTHGVISPLEGGDDAAEALAVGPDGSIVVTGSIAVADNDDDAWTRKLEPEDGTEIWTAMYNGPGVGEYSTDNAGPVAVGPDGTVAVLAQAYVDFSTAPATLLVYGEGGGEPVWTWTPADDGASQELSPIGVAIDDDGNVYAAYQRVTSVVRFWVAKFEPDGTETWLYGDDHFVGRDMDWSLSGLGIGPNGPSLIGSYTAIEGSDAWVEAWIAQTDGDAAPLCLFTPRGEGSGVLPPGLVSQAGTVALDGKVLAVGQWIDDAEEALWIARLHAWGD